MTYYNTLNVKLSNLQPNKLKSGIKNGTEVTLKASPNVVCNSNNDILFRILLLTNTHFSRLRKPFTNNLSANIKLSRTRLQKIGQSEGFFVNF